MGIAGDVVSKHLGRKNQRAVLKLRQGKERVLLKPDLAPILSFAQEEKVRFCFIFWVCLEDVGKGCLGVVRANVSSILNLCQREGDKRMSIGKTRDER